MEDEIRQTFKNPLPRAWTVMNANQIHEFLNTFSTRSGKDSYIRQQSKWGECGGAGGGTSRLGSWGAWTHIKFGGKIWGKVRPSSPNKRKNKTQKLRKNPNFGVKSEIQRAKFGVFVTYIFGGEIWGSSKNFRGKFLGQASPTS